MITSSMVLANLNWLRLLRSRTIYVTAVLALLAISNVAIGAAFVTVFGAESKEPWNNAVESILRLVIPIGAAIHASGAVGDELEQKTFTYLWSRPIPRTSVVLGRLLVVIPFLFAVAALSLVVCYLFASKAVTATDLNHSLEAALASSVACSCFAVAGGAMFPRQPMLFTIGVFLVIEQFLFAIPVAKYISIVGQTRVLAGLVATIEEPSNTTALLCLFGLSALWLSIALFSVSSAEYAAQKE